jgi:hypothetical protein
MSRGEKQERSILNSFSKSVGKHPFRQYSHGSYGAVREGRIDRPMRVIAPGFGAGAVGGYVAMGITAPRRN